MVLADVLKRWQELKGKPALLLTGTDEHGLKIQQSAAANETTPKLWCDANAAKFMELADKSKIKYDFFMRTTDDEHKDAVRHFWFLLEEAGYIYEKKHEGWYCVSDEAFYPTSMLEKRVEGLTGKVTLVNTETGNPVEWIEEKNYHFRMTALKDRLLEFYEQNPDWITPQTRMNEVISWVKNNLEDLSISRPSSRLDWGIRVPNDDSQTIYVWVDALVNYLTKAGFPAWTPGREYEGGWPADVQVIGKDILRFHGVYWPALLLAVDLPLPRRLLSHAHWTMSGKKMSKSIGNVVNPFYAINRWGLDTMRFFMIHDGGIADDSDYDNDFIVERYKKCLANTIGNLLSRVTRPKKWSVKESVQKASLTTHATTKFPSDIQAAMREQQALLENMHLVLDGYMNSLNPRKALVAILGAAGKVDVPLYPPLSPVANKRLQTNKFLVETEPWVLAAIPEDDKTYAENRVTLNLSIYMAAEGLRNIGISLQPFMPDKAAELLDTLGVQEDRRTFQYAGFGKDYEYGTPMINPGQGSHMGLFPPLEVET